MRPVFIVLFVVAAGCECGPAVVTIIDSDAGARGDAGLVFDAGTPPRDAGTRAVIDAGVCTNAAACASDQFCDQSAHRCVACRSSRDCPSEKPLCDFATNTCEARCKSSASCASPRPVCDTALGACIEGTCAFEGACAAWRRLSWSACHPTACTRTRVVECIDSTGGPSTACSTPAPSSSEACFDCGGVTDAGQPPVDAGQPDAGQPDAGRPPELCASTSTSPLPLDACHATLKMLALTVSNPSCYVDVAAHPDETAELYWDCHSANGRAELRFQTFTAAGAWNSQTVSVCYGTHFAFSDGCNWQSAQRVAGPTTAGSTLTFTYEEQADPGQSGCLVPCTATGTFVVQ